MTSPHDLELDALGALWRTSEQSLPRAEALRAALGRRERAARRRGLATLLLECLTTVAVFALVSRWVPLDAPLAGLAWTLAISHTAIIWIAVLWLRRGLWRGIEGSSADYLAALRRRATAQRAGAEFGAVLLAVESIALGIAWVAYADSATAAGILRPSLLAVALFASGGTLCLGQWRAARRALAQLDEIERSPEPPM